MRAVIIDDDPFMRENLISLLSLYCEDVEIVGEADGVKSGVAQIKELQPEIVFMDIEMKDGTGFDLLSILGKSNFKLIFVTGHNNFAIKAFKFSAVDYLLKPVDPDDLIRAVEKAKTTANNDLQIKALLANQKDTKQKIVITTRYSWVSVSIS